MAQVGLINKQNNNNIPLVRSLIRINLLDVIGEVELEQTYINQGDDPIEATYKFALNGNNAVHKFEAKIDGNVIVANVMEKGKAEAVYEDAISAGNGAYLLEQKDENFLQISVGNLPPNKTVTLTVTYVQELVKYDKETLQITLPNSLYTTLETFPEVQAKIKMPLPIVQVTTEPYPLCHSTIIQGNSAEVHIPPAPKTGENIVDSNLDISILIKLGPGLGRPRLWVEKWEEEFDPLAVLLAVSPETEILPQEQEIIFLLDRSASMLGEPTSQLTYTMFHALKFIPSISFFNIVCFGDSHQFLFPDAVPPSFDNLHAARQLISKLPELGGTELLKPLVDIYSKTGSGRKRHIVLLTDGRVNTSSACIDVARKHSDDFSLSTIGIGNVDKQLVKELAEVGKGKCEIISLNNIDNLENVMTGILQWTLEPAYENVNITWYDANGAVCEGVKKAPEKLPPIYEGDLYKIYALVSSPKIDLTSAKLQATGKAGELNLHIDLKTAEIETKVNGKLIHLLAAKQLIREIEEGAYRKKLNEAQQKEEIVRLGVAYNLASTHTSFVATEDRVDPITGTMTPVSITVTPAPPSAQTKPVAISTPAPRSGAGGGWGGGSFWRTFGFFSVSNVDTILDRESFSLEELLDEEDILQEVKSQNRKLIEYLTRPATLLKLFEFITVEPSEDANPKRRNKYPHLACEILAVGNFNIAEAIFKFELLHNLFAFLETPPPLNLVLSGYACRIIQELLSMRTTETLAFIQKREAVITKLIAHLGNDSILELVQKIVGCEELPEGAGVIQWLSTTELVPCLVAKLDPNLDESMHESAGQALSSIINTCYQMHSYPLISQLESEKYITQLFAYIFSGSTSVLLQALSVVIALLRTHSHIHSRATSALSISLSSSSSSMSSSSLPPLPPNPPLLPLFALSIEKMEKFEEIIRPSSGQPTALGFSRLKIVEFYLSLLQTQNKTIESAFIKQGTLKLILDLFFTYHWNNFLHSLVEQIIKLILEGHNEELQKELLVNAGLLDRIVEANKLNINGQSKKSHPGYMGYLTRISLAIALSPSFFIISLIENNFEWKIYFSNFEGQKNPTPLGGPLPPRVDNMMMNNENNNNNNETTNNFDSYTLNFDDPNDDESM